MSNFYVKKLYLSGNNVETSSIEFTNNLNIICCPSDSEKNCILECINFILGCDNKDFFLNKNSDYDALNMEIATNNGPIFLKRHFEENHIYVTSLNSQIESGKYSITKSNLYIGDLFLKLIEINSPPLIIPSYGQGDIFELSVDESALDKDLAENFDLEEEKKIDFILNKITEKEREIAVATINSKHLSEEIYKLNDKLTQCSIFARHHQNLRSQYTLDIRRLIFMAEDKSSKIEVNNLLLKIEDLNNAESDLICDLNNLQKKSFKLAKKRKEIQFLINSKLKPEVNKLKEYLLEDEKFCPCLFIIGSSALSLKDKVKGKALDSRKGALFEYLLNHPYDGQTIVVENHITEMDYEGVNVIKFSKNSEIGRYGFLHNVK